MRTCTQKKNPPSQRASVACARSSNQAVLQVSQPRAEDFTGLLHRASSHFAYDFSRIPVHPPATGALQTKLAINPPGDIYEQEADRVSREVMQMPAPQVPRTCACDGQSSGSRTAQPGQAQVQTMHVGSSDPGQTAVPPIVHEVLRSSGRLLDPAARRFMEPRFGHDFSKLRVHTDAKAAASAEAIGAAAYTVGKDVVFGEGRFSPQSRAGRHLLAHELTHVVQQRKSSLRLQQQPKKGKVVRIERVNRFRRKPPGPGAYTQEELNKWYEDHPKATNAGGANLEGGERTKESAYTPEELWRRGYYYAKTTVSDEMKQAWETWLTDEGDGKVITIFVRYDK